CDFRCPVSCSIRAVKMATWTSDEPLSFWVRALASITSRLRAASRGIRFTFFPFFLYLSAKATRGPTPSKGASRRYFRGETSGQNWVCYVWAILIREPDSLPNANELAAERRLWLFFFRFSFGFFAIETCQF